MKLKLKQFLIVMIKLLRWIVKIVKKLGKLCLKLLKKIKISSLFTFIFLTLALIIYYVSKYINEAFYNITVDQLLYSLKTAEGTSQTIFIDGAKYVLERVIPIYLIILIIIIVFKLLIKNKTYLVINIKNKDFKFSIYPISRIIRVLFTFILLILSVNYFYVEFSLENYLNPNRKTQFFEVYYTDPKNIKLTAPKEKRNLIYIYVESLETSLFSNKSGGNFNESVIPNLEKLAKDNINFSGNNKLGGANALYGSTWTVAGMVSSSAGVPLKVPIDGNMYSGYGEFLPGVYSLGDTLEDNGYKNYLMIGSDANFGGRKDYFTYHGNYEIKDYNYAKEKGYINDNYYVWWGYEDSKLFEFAKEELMEIAKEDEPFNFTMLTTDTHFTDGYVENFCKTPYDYKYLNAYNCSDSMIGEFIKWIQKQDFYKDTTIVITGDHLSMQANISSMFDSNDYDRSVYNVYINSACESKNTNNRKFTTFDYYPTTLAALGFDIDGNRLGLGTNLFSKRQTLAEEIGLDKLDDELSKNSKYYNNRLLGDSYKELKKAVSSE